MPPMNNLARLSEPWRAHQQRRRRRRQCKHTQAFCHSPRGSDKVQTSCGGEEKKKKYRVTPKGLRSKKKKANEEGEEEGEKILQPCDYSLKLGIIRSQTWFTPCSSLIVLKSSVTKRRRRRRRMPTSKHTHTHACASRSNTHTIGRDGE